LKIIADEPISRRPENGSRSYHKHVHLVAPTHAQKSIGYKDGWGLLEWGKAVWKALAFVGVAKRKRQTYYEFLYRRPCSLVEKAYK
jgi:hypothetical protein